MTHVIALEAGQSSLGHSSVLHWYYWAYYIGITERITLVLLSVLHWYYWAYYIGITERITLVLLSVLHWYYWAYYIGITERITLVLLFLRLANLSHALGKTHHCYLVANLMWIPLCTYQLPVHIIIRNLVQTLFRTSSYWSYTENPHICNICE